MTNVVRVAIIGTGWGLRIQVPALRKSGLEVNAIWARNGEKANKIAREHNIPFASDDWKAVVERTDVDLISIVTPPSTHKEITLHALKIGKHVLCEKPTAMNAKEAEEMLHASQLYPNQLALIDHELRFLPSMIQARDFIRNGKLGDKIHHVEAHVLLGSRASPQREWNWWFSKEFGGGVLGAVGSHLIDSVTYITGKRIRSVSGITSTSIKQRPDPETKKLKEVTSDDYCSLQIIFEDGVPGVIHCSVVRSGLHSHRIAIAGAAGTLNINMGHLSFFPLATSSSDVKEITIVDDKEFMDKEPPLNDLWGYGTLEIAKAIKGALIDKDMNQLEKAATFEDGLYVQKVIDATHKSNDERIWVNIN